MVFGDPPAPHYLFPEILVEFPPAAPIGHLGVIGTAGFPGLKYYGITYGIYYSAMYIAFDLEINPDGFNSRAVVTDLKGYYSRLVLPLAHIRRRVRLNREVDLPLGRKCR